MADPRQIIADNLSRIRERMAESAVAAGRHPDDVALIGVTKYVDISQSSALLAAGCDALGESRPQQLWQKAGSPELDGASWHLVGHLQRNKVPRTLPLVQLIHSVDSLRLLQAIDEGASHLVHPVNVLLEVNCSGDEAKHGVSADGLKQLLDEAPRFTRVRICGLMTMAALEGGEDVAAKNFATLRELRDKLAPRCAPEIDLRELSMGMSHDFEVAIREGATMVRIGSLLFEGLPK